MESYYFCFKNEKVNEKKIMMLQKEPRIVKSHDVHIDADYADWIAEVKHRYRSAQVKAAVKVNAEKLLFNWQLGRDLVQKKAEERWGAGVVEQVSLDLKREFPDAGGFSASNLWFMKRWYLFYTQGDDTILQQVGAELQRIEEQYKLKLYQVGKEIADEKLYQTGKGISTPMGVATYNNIKIKDALPSQELLAERVRLLQKELQETKRLMNKNK